MENEGVVGLKCDICNRRNMECRMVNIVGEDFAMCQECYDREAEKGLLF